MILFKRTYAFAVSAMISFLAISCQDDDLQYAVKDISVDMQSPVTFVLDEVQTRADVTNLASFYVLCIKGALASTYETSAWSAGFSVDNSGYYTGGQYWPSTSTTYSFYASNKIMTTSVSGTYITAEPLTDVVVAKVSSATYKQIVPLTFNHIYAKIGYCKVSAPSGYTVQGLSVKITPYTGGRYYPYKNSWSNQTSSTITLASSLNNTTSRENLIVPGTYTLNVACTLTKDAYTESFSKTLSLTFVAGKKNNIEITLPAGNPSTPGGGVVVDPWEGDDDIIEEM